MGRRGYERYYVSDPKLSTKTKTKLVRGKYFKTMRRERQVLSNVESISVRSLENPLNNSFVDSNSSPATIVGVTLTKKDLKDEYRNLRYLYYRTLPRLFKWLYYPPDMARLQQLEGTLYTCLLAINLVFRSARPTNRLDNRRLWGQKHHTATTVAVE